MKISSPGRRETRRRLEQTHVRVLPHGVRAPVVYRPSDQASRVDLAVRVTAIARAMAQAAAYDDDEIIEDVGNETQIESSEVWWYAHLKQRAAVELRDKLLNRTGRKAHAQ